MRFPFVCLVRIVLGTAFGGLLLAPRAGASPLFTVTDLGPRLNSPPVPDSLKVARLVNNSGQVVTTVPVYATQGHPGDSIPLGPVTWYAALVNPDGQQVRVGDLGGDFKYSSTSAIDNVGQAVGTAMTADGLTHGFLWNSGQTHDLNALIPGTSNWTISSAINIDDNGRILATGVLDGIDHTVLMTPVPEPGSVALFGLVAAWFATRRGLRRVHRTP
jgi:probable HAF family extracellular repeat protein